MKRILTTGLLAIAALSTPLLRAADIAILQNGFEIRHETRETAGANTRLFLSTDSSAGYVDIPTEQIVRYERDDSITVKKPALAIEQNKAESKPVDIDSAVAAASKTHAIDPDLIASVIHAESRFNPHAISPKGAQGLMQLMPETASKLGVKDSFDANANVDGGTRYLRELLLRYNDDLAKALAAYNAGPGRVDQYKGIPPYRETRLYVAGIITDFNRKKGAQQKKTEKAHESTATAASRSKSRKQRVAATKPEHASGASSGQ